MLVCSHEPGYMVITVASGKGGTGKTTIAANLAIMIARDNPNPSETVWLVDCDVEEPNAGLFIQPQFDTPKPVTRLFPQINTDACNGCGRCAEICAFHAMVVISGKAMLFKDLCHACGSCALNCSEGAISEASEQIGVLGKGQKDNLRFAQGELTVGYPSPVPVIRDLKKWVIREEENPLFILDAAPGTTCPVVEALRGADFALLVTEPTPFGLHDLRLITQLVQEEFHIPCGVVINKSGERDDMIESFCQEKSIPVFMRLPLSRQIAEICARGQLLIDHSEKFALKFRECYQKIRSITPTNSGNTE